MDSPYPQRQTPARGVHVSLAGPNWVFLTVCTSRRERWLAQPSVHRALHGLWKWKATAWLVSDYLLMPDHLHLFCAPRDLNFTIERWIGFWKDQLAKQFPAGTNCRASDSASVGTRCRASDSALAGTRCRVSGSALVGTRCRASGDDAAGETPVVIGTFQRGGFHHRLRDEESYGEKWLYVRENPVRAGLVARPEDWAYQGRVHEIRW